MATWQDPGPCKDAHSLRTLGEEHLIVLVLDYHIGRQANQTIVIDCLASKLVEEPSTHTAIRMRYSDFIRLPTSHDCLLPESSS